MDLARSRRVEYWDERRRAEGVAWPAGLELVGDDVEVPLVDGRAVRAVDLDRAATTPSLKAVRDAVVELLPYYGSAHRGAGYKSVVTTRAFEGAREAVRRFVGARPDDAVVFVRSTTEACNLLAHCVGEDADVVVLELEHHANLLPWRRLGARPLPVPRSRDELISSIEAAVAARRSERLLVALTGVSNVTGELMPYEEVAAIAHRAGGRLFLDAAQLAPHRAVDAGASGVDYLALSGHKLYAPFGAGALVGRRDWLEAGAPMLEGGGAVSLVTSDLVVWKQAPERLESGTPNVLGAVALGAACDLLSATGMDVLATVEQALADQLDRLLAGVPGLRRLSIFGEAGQHVGVACFELQGLDHGLVAAALSAEHGVGVRSGCFCAHPLVRELLGVAPGEMEAAARRMAGGAGVRLPGAVRASLGIGTSPEDLARLAAALGELAERGPRWTYRGPDGDGPFEPDPDPRPGAG